MTPLGICSCCCLRQWLSTTMHMSAISWQARSFLSCLLLCPAFCLSFILPFLVLAYHAPHGTPACGCTPSVLFTLYTIATSTSLHMSGLLQTVLCILSVENLPAAPKAPGTTPSSIGYLVDCFLIHHICNYYYYYCYLHILYAAPACGLHARHILSYA